MDIYEKLNDRYAELATAGYGLEKASAIALLPSIRAAGMTANDLPVSAQWI